MHTFNHEDVTIFHDGDFGGEAHIQTETGGRVTVPTSALFAFVAKYVRTVRIAVEEQAVYRSKHKVAALEQAPDNEVLGVLLPGEAPPKWARENAVALAYSRRPQPEVMRWIETGEISYSSVQNRELVDLACRLFVAHYRVQP